MSVFRQDSTTKNWVIIGTERATYPEKLKRITIKRIYRHIDPPALFVLVMRRLPFRKIFAFLSQRMGIGMCEPLRINFLSCLELAKLSPAALAITMHNRERRST